MMPFAGLLVMFVPTFSVGPMTKLVSAMSAGTVLTKPEKDFPPAEEALQVFLQYQNYGFSL